MGLKRALVRGKKAEHWLFRDDCLVYRIGTKEVIVPVGDLVHDLKIEIHKGVLDDLNAPQEAFDELNAIIDGTRV